MVTKEVNGNKISRKFLEFIFSSIVHIAIHQDVPRQTQDTLTQNTRNSYLQSTFFFSFVLPLVFVIFLKYLV